MDEVQLLTRKINRLEKARVKAEQILEQKALQLWESKQELEKKVKERTQELEIAKDKAVKAQMAQKNFLANMSHEIRTPLNAIIGMAHLMSDYELNNQQKEYLNTLIHSANILQDLINDILDLSKIDSGKISVVNESFDLIDFLNIIKSIFLPQAKKKGLDFLLKIDSDIQNFVLADKKLLNHVLINLIGNALKFTERGSISLIVELHNRQEDKQYITFKCKDSGIGISKDQQEKIFNKFIQADKSTSRKYGGTGLGLSISKKIIELLGGTLEVASEISQGSTFYFTIPLTLSQEKSIIKTSPKKKKDKITIKQILIAEDNLLNQMYLKNLLNKWKIEYKIAQNGQEAIDLMASSEFDLVLMDIQMPTMDGYQATTQIRNTINNTIPIIALTANSFAEDREKAKQVGFSDFLSKPYNPNQLQELLLKYSR